MSKDRFDVNQHITDEIVAMLSQSGGTYSAPWVRSGSATRPRNAVTKRRYQGVNVLALWAAGLKAGYSSGCWATYQQWASLGAQVRKGEKSAYVVFFKDLGRDQEEAGDGASSSSERRARSVVARASAVFAAEQVTGCNLARSPSNPPATIEEVDAFVAATGAQIRHEGDQAYYRPLTDVIHLPPREAFVGSATSTSTQAYYATLFHELTHWTGHASRCARDLTGRFGAEAYAMEELVAELGAAFLSVDLGLAPAPRADHAHYLAHWLRALREDKRAIFVAAAQASRAAAYLTSLQTAPTEASSPPAFGRPAAASATSPPLSAARRTP